MIEISNIIKNRDDVINRLKSRGIVDIENKINTIIELHEKKIKIKQLFDTESSEINKITLNIEKMIKKKENADTLKNNVKNMKTQLEILKNDIKKYDLELKNLLNDVPNIPNKNVPIGKNSKENIVVFKTDINEQKCKKKPHYELIKDFDLIDFDLGIKLTGSGFPVYKNLGAKLQRALINLFLDEASKHGFKEYEVPIILNENSFYGTGQLPDKENQMYKTDDFYLIPTAEVPLTNIYRNEIVNEEDLPIKMTGYTPCFRREAGSWGKEVRGLNRVHQFDKIEIVEIVKPEESYKTLGKMRKYVEELVSKLELPYRVLNLCTGDLGFNSAFTYDIEVYSVGQDMWLEVSSISNFETFQANRMNLKYKNKKGEKFLTHTLNGSALALPRIVAALLEWNYDGEKIKIPKILYKYVDFTEITKNH